MAAPGSTTVGSTLRYDIAVRNTGERAASTKLTDRLPSELSVREVTATAATCTVKGNDVSCSTAELAPGVSAAVQVTVTAQAAGSATNTLTLARDAHAENNKASTTTEVTGASSEPTSSGTVVPPYEGAGATGGGSADAATGRITAEVPERCDQLADLDPRDRDCSSSAYVQQSFAVSGSSAQPYPVPKVVFRVLSSFASPVDRDAHVDLVVAVSTDSASYECVQTIVGRHTGASEMRGTVTIGCAVPASPGSVLRVHAQIVAERGLVPFRVGGDALVESISLS